MFHRVWACFGIWSQLTSLDMGNEESLLKLGGLTFAHPEPQQHVSEDFSSYRSLLAAAFSLPIFFFYF